MKVLRTLSVLGMTVAVVGLPASVAVAAAEPPPDVQRVEAGSIEGCDVTFEGVERGAGVLTYEHHFTDTHAFDTATNEWVLVPDTTPTVADVAFTPWTTAQQVAADCVEPPKAPGAVSQQVRSEDLDCVRGVVVSTVTTTVVGFTYDAATNAWVRGEPVDTVQVTESPAPKGACGRAGTPGGGVLDGTGSTPPPSPVQPGGTSATGVPVPLVVDAGAEAVPTGTGSPAWSALTAALALCAAGAAGLRAALRR